MILGVGCDIVATVRFVSWIEKSVEQQLRVFSQAELDELNKLSSKEAQAQFLASRFAVKEAFYKAFCGMLVSIKYFEDFPSFAQVRRYVALAKDKYGIPYLDIDLKRLEQELTICLPMIASHCSLAHEATHALAFVTIESL